MVDPDDGAPSPAGWQQVTPKAVRGFLLRLVLWYTLFLIPGTGIDSAYGAFFRFSGNAFLGSFVGDVSLDFRAEDSAKGMDTLIVLTEKTKGKKPVEGKKPTNSRLMGYLPTAFLVALVLATKAPWSRRRRRLLWGLPLICGVVAVRVSIDIYATLAPSPAFASVSISDSLRPTLSFIHELAAYSPSTGFIAAGIVWIGVTLVTEPKARA